MQFPSPVGFPNPLPQFTVETPNRTKQKQENPKKKEDRVVQLMMEMIVSRWLTNWLAGKGWFARSRVQVQYVLHG